MNNLPLVVLLASIGALNGQAHAIDSERIHFQNAAGVCQPALSAFDGHIRKRPLGLSNEGSEVAFVSCSLPRSPTSVQGHATYGILSVTVRASNSGNTMAQVTCTLVSSWDRESSRYVTQSSSLVPDHGVSLSFGEEDNGGERIFQPNFSCALMPGVSIDYLFYVYNEPIGN